MFVERETGGLGRGTIIARWRERFDGRSPRSSGPPGSAPVRPASPSPVRLPAKIAKVPGQARWRSARAGKLALLGVALLVVAGAGWYFRLPLVDGRPLHRSRPTTPMCAPTTRRSPPRWRAMSSSITVERQCAGARRRRDRHHRRRRLSAGGRCGARQGRDPAGDGRAHRPPDRGPAGRGRRRPRRSSPRRRRGDDRDAVRARPAAGAGRARIRQPADPGAGAGQPRPGRGRVQSAQAAVDAAHANVDVPQGAAAGGAAHPRRAAHRAGQGRARPVVHGDPRADRRRDRQPRGADRRLRADRPAAREPGAARRSLCRRQLQGDAARPSAARPERSPSAVDALPDQAIEGTVDLLAPASGAVFSLLPPDNATGNFTKIVQRLPVRVQRARSTSPPASLLRPGMSVVVSVNTKPGTVAGARRRTATAQVN